MKKTTLVTAVAAAMVLAGCSTYEGATRSNEYTAANPAAVYCVQQGGELDTVTENGERVTYCQLSENERFEQWEYYRNNHKEDGES